SGAIVGGLLLVKRIGVSSLALGTVAGAFFGPFFLNWLFAHRSGTRYRFILDWHDEGLREWVRLSLPLMAGVSLVTADNWIIGYFASTTNGAVSLMTYAKQCFTAPMAMLAQVTRAASLSLLAASGMIALGQPAIAMVFTGGEFSFKEANLCAFYFALFSLSLFLWSAQAIYARAFYAAG